MADKALVDFQTSVEKLVAKYAKDVNAYIENAKSTSKRRSDELMRAIDKLKAPHEQTGAALSGVINKALAEECKFLNGAVITQMNVNVKG